MTRPLRSPPITGGSSLLRAGPPADATTVLSIFRFSPVDALPLTTARGFARLRGCVDACLPTFRAEAADRARATFTPGTTWPVGGRPPGLVPGLLRFSHQDSPSADTWETHRCRSDSCASEVPNATGREPAPRSRNRSPSRLAAALISGARRTLRLGADCW